jgi:hypothetical protein
MQFVTFVKQPLEAPNICKALSKHHGTTQGAASGERAQGKASLEAYFDVPKRKGRPKKATLASDVTEAAKKNHADMGNKANAVSKKRGADNEAASSKKKEQKKTVIPRMI